MASTINAPRLSVEILQGFIPAAFLTGTYAMMPQCWSVNQCPGPTFLDRCGHPAPPDRQAAVAAGWTFVVVDLRPLPTRPASMGDRLWVPVCPDHSDDDTVWGVRQCVAGSPDMLWGHDAWALWGDSDVLSWTSCPQCSRVDRPVFRPGSSAPSGYQAAFTPRDLHDTAGRRYRGIVGISCQEHSVVLMDATAGV